jgi:hypothetical protein
VSPTPKDRVLYSNQIIIIITIITPNSENMLQSYPWAQLKNGPLILERESLNSELMKALCQLQVPATLPTSDTHWKFVREVYNFIHNLYKVKAAGIAP